jgi:hypothetical protein
MKSMAAYISGVSASVEGKTQKVQNSQRTVTTSIYPGVPGCGPKNYTPIVYPTKPYGSGCYKLFGGALPRICFK